MTATASPELLGWASSHDATSGRHELCGGWTSGGTAWVPEGDLDDLTRTHPSLAAWLRVTVDEQVSALAAPVDVEFRVRDSEPVVTRVRPSHLGGRALVRALLLMVAERSISPRRASDLLEPEQLVRAVRPTVDRDAARPFAAGLPVSGGIAAGPLVLSTEQARGCDVPAVLVADDLHPEHLADREHLAALVVLMGGATSHGAVVARAAGLPMVCAPAGSTIDQDGRVVIGGRALHLHDLVTVDGGAGGLYVGSVPTTPGLTADDVRRVLGWSAPGHGTAVLANADTPADVARAGAAGATGIGLCRLEHVLASSHGNQLVRSVIAAADDASSVAASDVLRTHIVDTMSAVFLELGAMEVTVRLLDAAEHELGCDVAGRGATTETNPMMGVRGVRQLVVHPRLAEAQVDALLIAGRHAGLRSGQLRLLVPMVVDPGELAWVRALVDRRSALLGVPAPPVGCMVETPRAALVARDLAQHADFLSVGGNDLTQFTLAMSRDDSTARLHQAYATAGMESALTPSGHDPAVRRLVDVCVREARDAVPGIPIGFCGEQVVEPSALVELLEHAPDYVSCGAAHVEVARYVVGRQLRQGGDAPWT